MNTIFSDNKIHDPSSTQQVSLKNLPIAPHLPMRSSYSPQKMSANNKKFFYPIRNQSSKHDG